VKVALSQLVMYSGQYSLLIDHADHHSYVAAGNLTLEIELHRACVHQCTVFTSQTRSFLTCTRQDCYYQTLTHAYGATVIALHQLCESVHVSK